MLPQLGCPCPVTSAARHSSRGSLYAATGTEALELRPLGRQLQHSATGSCPSCPTEAPRQRNTHPSIFTFFLDLKTLHLKTLLDPSLAI